eukprot:Plantae.Rhodophyta-Purpureofilum_apyrenoidigerum.ctg6610.p1 GENE.Plantae.Rhodophyta-Purpureofilum_apyrenoidigerum.ctg6610~~Plantae.Rhodophyta-Purpureofilum_apyrenoidigerum.ctg6610.p1  ORF type:complete len:150 (-),score=20.91 Plantae.Rhodophyta-Purpureofilum_apyrenoidigerum.ctg6610:200-649(-)
MATSESGVGGPPKPPPTYVRQDGPRPTGYKPLDFSRTVGSGRPRRFLPWILGYSVFQIWAFRRINEFNEHRRMLDLERKEIRSYVIPYLQAEEDIRMLEERRERIAKEREIMEGAKWDYEDNTYITRGGEDKPRLRIFDTDLFYSAKPK